MEGRGKGEGSGRHTDALFPYTLCFNWAPADGLQVPHRACHASLAALRPIQHPASLLRMSSQKPVLNPHQVLGSTAREVNGMTDTSSNTVLFGQQRYAFLSPNLLLQCFYFLGGFSASMGN